MNSLVSIPDSIAHFFIFLYFPPERCQMTLVRIVTLPISSFHSIQFAIDTIIYFTFQTEKYQTIYCENQMNSSWAACSQSIYQN